MLLFVSSFLFACMGLTVKWLATVPGGTGGAIPPDQVALMRSILPAVLLTPALFAEARRLGPGFRRWVPVLLLRGALGAGGLICSFRAISLIEFSNATLLNYTSPFFATFFATVFLREPLPKRALISLPLAFLGVLLVTRPALLFEGRLPAHVVAGTLYGLATGALAGAAYTSVRHLTGACSTESIVAVFSWTGVLATAPLAAPVYVAPNTAQWAGLVLMAGLAMGAQLTMTAGYRRYATAQASTLTLSVVIFATMLGGVFFREIPGPVEWIGLSLTLAGLSLLDARPSPALPLRTAKT